MSVQAWFTSDEVEIAPGSSMALTLSVENLGESTTSYTIVPTGLTASWVSVERGNLTVFAGSQDVVDVVVTPPMLPATTAGPTAVGVRVVPTDDPAETVVAEATLNVTPFDDRRIVALAPVVRARRRADFEFMVENHGNGMASCRLRLIDPSDRVDGSFDPPAVGVAPGDASLVRLKARARRGFLRRSVRTLDFEVEAEQSGHTPAAATLALVQPPTVPGAVLGRLAAVALLVGAAVAAWFGVVRPEIRDAAQDRVDERLERFQALAAQDDADGDTDDDPARPSDTTADEVGENPFVVSTTTSPPSAAADGEPDFFRLSVSPAVDETADDSYTVPVGQLFDLTDVRVENSNNDGGRATLSINGEEVYSWRLENIRGSIFEPRITPIRLEPQDNVTFSVRCDTVGDPATGTCSDAVNASGLVVPVDEL